MGKFPTEQEMAALVPFSLGTIQKAVGSLVSSGYVQRKGAGTFIIPREALGEPWIYRVLSVDGTRFVPMTSTVLRRIQIESDALWAWLRGDANDCEIVRLDRKIVAEDYAFISQYFADVNRFPYFMEADLDSMKGENFVQLTKKYIRSRHPMSSSRFAPWRFQRASSASSICLERSMAPMWK